MNQRDEDRREFPRHGVAVRVHVAQLGEVRGALTRDFSVGGLFVETQVAYAVGSCLPLRLIHPRSAEQIATVCEVVRHVRDEDGSLCGLGLRFTVQDGPLVAQLADLVASVATAASSAPTPAPLSLLERMPLGVVPRLRGAATDDLDPLLLQIIAFVDGRRDADAICRESGLSPVEGLAGIAELERRQLVVIERPHTTREEPEDGDRDVARAMLSDEQDITRRAFVEHRARELLSDAVRAERADRVAEAVSLLEQALTLNPSNVADIHLRMAHLALERLDKLDLARQHADALVRLRPDASETTDLLAAIEQAGSDRKKKHHAAQKAKPLAGDSDSRKRIALLAVAVLVLALVVGWNVWHFFSPRGPRPVQVAPLAVSAWVPASAASVHRGRLYVTVTAGWARLTASEQRQRLARLGDWAQRKLGTNDVVATDANRQLVGRVHGDAIQVYAAPPARP